MTHEMMTNFQFQPPRKHYNALQRIIYIARIQNEKFTGSVGPFVRAKAVLSPGVIHTHSENRYVLYIEMWSPAFFLVVY